MLSNANLRFSLGIGEGDYTWRYRIWEWFNDNAIAVTLVGPYTGTHPQETPAFPSPPPLYGATTPADNTIDEGASYSADVDASFMGKDAHWAYWGRQLAQDVPDVAAMVTQYQPDYLLVE